MSSPTLIFVPGSNSNSFSVAPLLRELTLLGVRALAVDLPGHGFGGTWPAAYQAPQDTAALGAVPSKAAGLTVADAAEHLAAAVRRAREHGPVVVVAHSRGGLPLTRLVSTEPELVDRAVYIAAWCPVAATVAEYMAVPEYAASALNGLPNVLVADPAQLGALRMNWRKADPDVLAALKHAMLADGTDEELLAYLALLDPDEILDPGERADPARWGRVPHTYVRLADDTSMPPAMQDRLIADADAVTPHDPFAVHTLPGSHAGFLVRAEARVQAAQLLARIAGGTP
ncbi:MULTISPECIES: alpha/beta fold hydrolase [Prauserella salsuginis group]|uniref:Alpha/beta fold hydrolase n=1 Tax=Prauserella salsuginis TaxID=387889 RepID=A0ABW6GAK6_9PSEU|nr:MULTISPECIES: alpha/beta hydrolase [Prauserella salsuginis group]MCR3722916.1 Alpha/beta hydrolase family protein [Prauserella flava]MCR3737409.1 Alpha/beta hydrolase family protein [Prauserella salsuginis]